MIADHGHPVAVLLSWEEFSHTQPAGAQLTQLLAHPASADVDLPLERDATPHGPVQVLVHDLTVVTRNTADFPPDRFRIVDPWHA